MFESTWILRDPAGRLTFHPKVAVTAAPDIAIDGEVIGYGVGVGRNLIDHLYAANLLSVATSDPGGLIPVPCRDPSLVLTRPDPAQEAAYLAARARRLAARLDDSDPELGLRPRGIVADVAGDAAAVAGAVTALMVAIEKVRAALTGPPAASDMHPTSRAV